MKYAENDKNTQIKQAVKLGNELKVTYQAHTEKLQLPAKMTLEEAKAYAINYEGYHQLSTFMLSDSGQDSVS